VTVTVGEPLKGTITLGFPAADCERLVQAVLGDEAPPESAVADLLREIAGQAVGGLRQTPYGEHVLFCVETPVPSAPSAGAPDFYELALPDFSLPVAVWSECERPGSEADVPIANAPAAVTAATGGPSRAPAPTPAAVPANLDVILDIDLPLSVRFGQTEMTLEALTRLGPGSVVDLGRSPDEPVDVLVNGRLVARAEVVVVGGSYGVRILEVVSAADRARSFGA
jgi:flagellar motor switch protein FliN